MQIGRARFGAARIAWVNSAEAPEPTDSVWAQLGEAQHRRYWQLSGARARDFAASRELIALLVNEISASGEWTLTALCERCGEDDGRPRVVGAPVAVSVSYSYGTAAVAAVSLTDASAVGIDIERRTAGASPGRMDELAALFAPHPAPDLAGWTLLEAALKADGRGLRVPVGEVVVGDIGSGRQPDSCAVVIPGSSYKVDAATLRGPEGFVLSAAVVVASR